MGWGFLIVERRGRRSLQVLSSSADKSKKRAMKFVVLKAKVGDKGEGQGRGALATQQVTITDKLTLEKNFPFASDNPKSNNYK